MSEANNGGRGDRACGRVVGGSRLLLLASYLGIGLAIGRLGTHGWRGGSGRVVGNQNRVTPPRPMRAEIHPDPRLALPSDATA